MYSQAFVLTEIDRVVLTLFIAYLILPIIYFYRDFKSYRRQGKKWVWYKRPYLITTIGKNTVIIGLIFSSPIEIVPAAPLLPFLISCLVALALWVYSLTLETEDQAKDSASNQTQQEQQN
jgi:hypothetical protein